MARHDSESQPRSEAWRVLAEIFLHIEGVSEAGTVPENLARVVADDDHFSKITAEHEIPPRLVGGIAREIAAAHARILEAIRERERELTKENEPGAVRPPLS